MVVVVFLFSIKFYYCFLSVIVSYCIRKLKGLRVSVFSNVNLLFEKPKYKPFQANEPNQGTSGRREYYLVFTIEYFCVVRPASGSTPAVC